MTQASAAADATLQVCVRRDTSDLSEFNLVFSRGPIRIPAGTVFDYAGHTFNGAADPLDDSHSAPGPAMWKGITAAEKERRGQLLVADSKRDMHHKAGLITLTDATLTKARSCAALPVAAVLSPDWSWTVSPVFGSSDEYYQAYGVMRAGKLNTDWSKEPEPLQTAGIGGALNGVLQNTTTRTIDVR